jgi:hypothetical protein
MDNKFYIAIIVTIHCHYPSKEPRAQILLRNTIISGTYVYPDVRH